MHQKAYSRPIALIMSTLLLSSLLVFSNPALQTINDFKLAATQDPTRVERNRLKETLLLSQLTLAQADAKKYNYEGGDRVSALKRRLLVHLDPLIASEAIRLERQQQIVDDKALEAQIENELSDYTVTLEQIKLTTTAITTAQMELAIARVNYQHGQIKEVELNEKVSKLRALDLKKLTEQASLKKQQYTLNALIGMPLEDEITLQYALKPLSMPPTMVTPEVAEQILETKLDIQRAQSAQAIAQLKFDHTSEFYKDFDKEYQEALYTLEIAKLDALNTKKAALLEFLDLQAQLHHLYEAYLIEVESVAIASEINQTIQSQLNNGTLTELDSYKAIYEVEQSHFHLLQSIHAYNRTYRHFTLHYMQPPIEPVPVTN